MSHQISHFRVLSRRPGQPSYRFLALLALLAGVVASGCGTPAESNSEADASEDGRLHVVCTTGQVADIVTRVGADHVRMTSIMGPGVDPHVYKATQKDIDDLNRADVIFYSGLHLEGRLAERLKELDTDRPSRAVTAILEKEHSDKLRSPEEFEGHYDPHVWFDPTIWVHCVQVVADLLAEKDPEHRDAYLANAKAYADEILAAHEQWKEQLATIEPERRVLVTAHDAFGYFGKAYGLEVRGLQGISTADETDLSTVNDLVELLVSRKIKAVFVESSVSQRAVRSLIEGCKAKGHEVVVGGELYSDAMGVEGTDEGTYVGMMNHNVRTIVKSLK